MIINLKDIDHIYMAVKPVDFRKALNGLVGIIENEFCLDSTSHTLFLFTNRKRSSIKIVYFDKNGFWLFQKILLNNDKFMWPKKIENDTISITDEQLEWLLKGMEITPKHHFRDIRNLSVS